MLCVHVSSLLWAIFTHGNLEASVSKCFWQHGAPAGALVGPRVCHGGPIWLGPPSMPAAGAPRTKNAGPLILNAHKPLGITPDI